MKHVGSPFSRKYLVPLLAFFGGAMLGSDEKHAVAGWAIYGALLVLIWMVVLQLLAYRREWRQIRQRRVDNLAALHQSATKVKK